MTRPASTISWSVRILNVRFLNKKWAKCDNLPTTVTSAGCVHDEYRTCDGHTRKFCSLETLGPQLKKTRQKYEILLLPACLWERVANMCWCYSRTTGSAKRIKGKQVPATLSVHASRLSHNNDEIKFKFAGHKLVCNTTEDTEDT